MMEAANRGASMAGGKTVGLHIDLTTEEIVNPYVTPDLVFRFHYFFMRKFWFVYLAKALVIFPGGIVRALGRMAADYYGSLATNGTTEPFRNQMLDFDGLNRVIGTPETIALGKHYEGA